LLVSTSPSRPPSTTLRCLPSTVVFCDNDCPPGSVVPSPGTVNGWTMLPIAPMSASGGMYLAISSRPSTRSTTERLKAAGALLAQMAVADISGEEGPGDQVADRAVARHRSCASPKHDTRQNHTLSGFLPRRNPTVVSMPPFIWPQADRQSGRRGRDLGKFSLRFNQWKGAVAIHG
jgi:hypothetical protein